MTTRRYPLAELIACAKREHSMRKVVYPRWVAAGRIKQDKVDREMDMMADIVSVLEDLAAREAAESGMA